MREREEEYFKPAGVSPFGLWVYLYQLYAIPSIQARRAYWDAVDEGIKTRVEDNFSQ